MFELLDEICIKENIKVFDIIETNKCYLSPYNFEKYVKKNITFNEFTNYCLKLLKYNVLQQEIQYLQQYYSKKKIKLKQLIYYINNIHIFNYKNLIESYIINKRFEYLLEYLKINNYPLNFIDYIYKQLKSLYSSSKYLLNYV